MAFSCMAITAIHTINTNDDYFSCFSDHTNLLDCNATAFAAFLSHEDSRYYRPTNDPLAKRTIWLATRSLMIGTLMR